MSDAQEVARDRQLDLLEEHRGDLVEEAREIAQRIASGRGTVTSAQVLSVMRSTPRLARMMDGKDPRFMGAVFRAGKGWRRVGWSPVGSHKRPCAVWELRKDR